MFFPISRPSQLFVSQKFANLEFVVKHTLLFNVFGVFL
jgi:hypothetical protein